MHVPHTKNLMLNLHIFPTPADTGSVAARFVSELAAEAMSERGRFTVAFSGGSLPQMVCTPLVADQQAAPQIDWSGWHVFFADERFVPLTHAESNYRLVREALFDHAPIPSNQIIPMSETVGDTESAAAIYQQMMRAIFHTLPNQWPRFDCILLGMGPDGHTASLFPDHPLLDESTRWVAPIHDSPKPPPARITFTLPLINAARHVVFVVTGANKAENVQAALATPTPKVPASLVRPLQGEVHWFVDEAAGKMTRFGSVCGVNRMG